VIFTMSKSVRHLRCRFLVSAPDEAPTDQTSWPHNRVSPNTRLIRREREGRRLCLINCRDERADAPRLSDWTVRTKYLYRATNAARGFLSLKGACGGAEVYCTTEGREETTGMARLPRGMPPPARPATISWPRVGDWEL